MKYLKLFENHLSESEVVKICRKYDISDWTLNSDGTVDVEGSVYLGYYDLTELPLNFGRVDGNFHCQVNQLTSLEGCPNYVGGNFYCPHNNIRSFEGIGNISGGFYCGVNPIECLWDLFQDTSKIEIFNEWEVIQDDKVILYRLNDFLAEIGKEDVTEEQLNQIKKYYKVIE